MIKIGRDIIGLAIIVIAIAGISSACVEKNTNIEVPDTKYEYKEIYWQLDLKEGNLTKELREAGQDCFIRFEIEVANDDRSESEWIKWSIYPSKNRVGLIQTIEPSHFEKGIEQGDGIEDGNIILYAKIPEEYRPINKWLRLFQYGGYGGRLYWVEHEVLSDDNGSRTNPTVIHIPYEAIEDLKYDILYVEGKRYRFEEVNGTVRVVKMHDSHIVVLEDGSDFVK